MSDHAVHQVEKWQNAGDSRDGFNHALHALFGWRGIHAGDDFRWRMPCGVLKPQDGRGEPLIQMAHLTADVGGTLSIDVEAGLDILALIPVVGRVGVARDGQALEAGDSRGIVCQPLSPLSIALDAGGEACSLLIVTVAYAWMQRFLFELLQMPVEKDLQVGPWLDPASAKVRLLEAFAAILCSDAVISQSRDLPLALQQRLMETFSHVLLESVPHRYSARLAAPKAGPMPNYVRLARDYMHREARRNPSMADVAKAAGISVRTLETSFRQYLDVTPHAYLRTVRLRMARQALSSRGNGASIAGIATEYGFPHAGRFAQYYTELFGESPSDTRRKGPQKTEEGDGI